MTEDHLAALRDARTVRIETSRGEDAPVHRTIIWVVVDEADRILVRTYRGPGSRWYREVLANPRCRLLVGDRAVELVAERADDPERIAACSEGLRVKYRRSASLDEMLRDGVLGTTLQLRPVHD